MSDLTRAAEAANNKQPTVRQWIERQAPAIEAQLAGVLKSDSFIRAAISEISKSDLLQQATPQSVLGAIMLAAQLKLEIGSGLGHFYLTPRSKNIMVDGHNEKIWECLPIIGYQGFIQLAYNSGQVGKIETLVVREGDFFEYGANSERGRFFDWKPKDLEADRPWTDIVVMAQIIGGGIVWETLPKDKILARRDKVAYWEKGPWKTHEEEMARKTLVREIAPYIPKSTEFALAVQKSREVEEEGKVVASIEGVSGLVVSNGADQAQEKAA